MGIIFAIDPGTTQSGWVVTMDGKPVEHGIADNHQLRKSMWFQSRDAELAIEMIASYGMPVGAEVFQTCVWIGRFLQVWAGSNSEFRAHLIYRKDVKMELCGSPRAKDAHIRQALIDRLGAPGTKKSPGGTYGIKSHAWAALAVAETHRARIASVVR